MDSYDVIFKPSATKDLRSLPKTLVARVMQSAENLKDEPFPRQSIKLSGSDHLYRLRVGDYRVIYGVDQEARRATVHYIRHRRDVYRTL
mgnify:CR=1 FL=1